MIARECNVKVIYDIPSEIEKAGYSTATKAIMTAGKLKMDIKWEAVFHLDESISETLRIINGLF